MAFQDWSVPEYGSLILQWRKGTALPTPINFNVNLRDIFGEPEAVGYDTLEYAFAPFGLPPSWVGITGISLGTYYPITSTGISVNLNCSLTSTVSSLEVGNSSQGITIYIFGRNGQGAREIIFSTYFRLIIEVYHATQPILKPGKLRFNHNYQSLVPAYKEMSVDAIADWELVLAKTSLIEVEVASGTLSIETITISGEMYFKLIGNYSATFNIRPSQDYLNTLSVSATLIELALGNFSSTQLATGWGPQYKRLEIIVSSSEDIICTPSSLFFHAIKTVFEAPVQTINITSSYDFDLTLPAWATSLPAIGTVGSNDIDVAVSLSSSLPADTYTGNIIVEYDNGNGIQQYLIPITYLIDGFVVLPYDPTQFNFTLDNKMVDFYTDLDNTFFDVLMNVKAFDFYSQTFNSYIVPFKIPLLRGRQKENIGLKIHRLMKRVDELNQNQTLQYKTCEVFLQVKERNLDTLVIQREFTLENIQFIAGVQPILSNGMGILTLNNFPTRVTSKSFQFVNLLIKNGSRKIEIYKNEELQISYFVNGLDFNIYKDKVNFEDLQCKEGDVVEYKLFTEDSGIDFVSKKFYVFPDSCQDITIVWEDEFKLQSNFQLTGEYALKYEFDSITFKKYKNIVEVLENVQTNRDVAFSINTGAVLNTDQITIDSICRSRKAWLLFPNKTIEIIPQTKTFVAVDSDREVSSFDLQFIINKNTNEEIYTL